MEFYDLENIYQADAKEEGSLVPQEDAQGKDVAVAPDDAEEQTIPMGYNVSLHNIVATCNLGTEVDLPRLSQGARNAEFNPKRFAAVIMRIRDPKTTALIFSSGKLVVTGAKNEDLARIAARKYARLVQRLGFPNVRFKNFKIQNMVGSVDVRFPIRLESLATEHEDYSSYEPELFPGLIYRMVEPKIVLRIFVSGKIVMTGAKSREQIQQAFENIYPVLLQHRKSGGDAM